MDQPTIVEHFCLDENDRLDQLEALLLLTEDPDLRLGALEAAVRAIRAKRGRGQWIKVAERMYRIAAGMASDVLNSDDCRDDLVAGPAMSKYVFRYLIARERF